MLPPLNHRRFYNNRKDLLPSQSTTPEPAGHTVNLVPWYNERRLIVSEWILEETSNAVTPVAVYKAADFLALVENEEALRNINPFFPSSSISKPRQVSTTTTLVSSLPPKEPIVIFPRRIGGGEIGGGQRKGVFAENLPLTRLIKLV
jgi:hypothetical protein